MDKIEALKKLLNHLKNYALVTIAIEVICTGLIGLGASKVTDFFSAWSLLMIFSSIILIVILSYKYYYLKDFPSTLIDSIKNDFQSQSLESDFSRISLINDSIAKSLISLNAQTCQLEDQASGLEHLHDEPVENKLCDQGLQNGLINLIQSFLKNLHNIVESGQSKFTVGIYLDWYNEIPKEGSGSLGEYYKSGTFILKDDLNLGSEISSEIFNAEGLTGVSLEIQSWIKACFNNGKAQFHNKLRERNDLSIYANNIPVVCSEDDSSGVLFIVGDKMEDIPNDFNEVTRIHNRIISNWINKYNDCIRQRILNDGLIK
ncbi:MAG: hypothetical protein DSY77_15975 [Bacteroidetes bacterium]|nr:MAG: hypothetical protein DSY77_15975 [Bacteroidota bacterium]